MCVAFGTMCGFRHPLGSSHISTRGWKSLGLLYKYASYDVALLSFSGQPKYMNYEGCSFCRETVREQPGLWAAISSSVVGGMGKLSMH